jgi:hypothetical protein
MGRRLHTDIKTLDDDTKSEIPPIPIKCDNQGALKLIKSGVVRAKTKHIDVRYNHSSYDEQKQGTVDFSYIASRENIADILTKSLATPGHQELVVHTPLFFFAD